jgi:hypothetical protein
VSSQEPVSETEISTNPLLEKLIVDGEAADAVTLRGYISRPAEDGMVVVYPSLNDLSISVYIARDDIIQFAQAAESETPHPATVLWIKKHAEVTVRSTVKVQAGQLGGLTRRTPLTAPVAELAIDSTETPAELRTGRLRIQMPASRATAAGVCHGGQCVSVCNCVSTCCILQPPT